MLISFDEEATIDEFDKLLESFVCGYWYLEFFLNFGIKKGQLVKIGLW